MNQVIEFQTETGSTYRVDYGKRTWKRLYRTTRSGPIRAEGGNLVHYPAIIVGQPCTLMDDAILPGAEAHAVQTSRVMKARLVKPTAKELPKCVD